MLVAFVHLVRRVAILSAVLALLVTIMRVRVRCCGCQYWTRRMLARRREHCGCMRWHHWRAQALIIVCRIRRRARAQRCRVVWLWLRVCVQWRLSVGHCVCGVCGRQGAGCRFRGCMRRHRWRAQASIIACCIRCRARVRRCRVVRLRLQVCVQWRLSVGCCVCGACGGQGACCLLCGLAQSTDLPLPLLNSCLLRDGSVARVGGTMWIMWCCMCIWWHGGRSMGVVGERWVEPCHRVDLCIRGYGHIGLGSWLSNY